MSDSEHNHDQERSEQIIEHDASAMRVPALSDPVNPTSDTTIETIMEHDADLMPTSELGDAYESHPQTQDQDIYSDDDLEPIKN
ncbi:Inositol-pentakisphosphate 2-kinase, partial [Ascosphaera pollenicola]